MTDHSEEQMLELLTDIREAIVSTGIILHSEQQQHRRNQAYLRLVAMAKRIGVIDEEPQVKSVGGH
jgi:hypothetical protein